MHVVSLRVTCSAMLRALLQGLLRGLVLLAVIGGVWFLYRSSTGSPDSEAAGESVGVSAEQLASAYEASAVQGDAQYKGRRLSVAGTIRSVEIGPALKLAGDTAFSSVWARLQSSQADTVARLGQGTRVNLTCLGGGVSQRMPLLYDCVVVP